MLWADERIFFLDFGMVGELSPEMRAQLLLLLLAFWQEDVPFLTEVARDRWPLRVIPEHWPTRAASAFGLTTLAFGTFRTMFGVRRVMGS